MGQPLREQTVFQPPGSVESWETAGSSLMLDTQDAEVRLDFMAPDLVRVRMTPRGATAPGRSWAVAAPPDRWPAARLDVTEGAGRLTVVGRFPSGEGLTVEVEKEGPGLSIKRPDGTVVAVCAPEGGLGLVPASRGGGGQIEAADGQALADKIAGGAPDVAIDGTILRPGGTAAVAPGTGRGDGSGFAGSGWAMHAPAGVRYYGFGQKQGFLDKRGQRLSLWATDEPLHILDNDELYQAIPFFMTMDEEGLSTGVFVDCPGRVTYDVAKARPDACVIETALPTFDAYVFAGPGPKDVIERYTALTGRMEMPPLWALGYQQCRYSYYPESRVREVAKEMREREIPCDAIYLDIHYMDGYRVFTWDKERFPDPKQMVADLAADGFKTITIIDPGVKVDGRYEVFQEGIRDGHFVCHPDGELFIGTVWPGRTAFPDFLREETRRWWGDKHKELIQDIGIAAIWNDMNEPSCFARNTFPDEVLQGEDGERVRHADVHNVYGQTMAVATYEALKRLQPDKRPFLLTRSGYAGIQRYAAVWMGDNHSWWEHLHMGMPMCLGMGVSGVPFVGVDIGGFQRDANGELFARWVQMGAFLPFCRNHSALDTIDQEPWSFGPEVEDIARQYLRLRYRLLPFLYNEFYKASVTGLPIMRPLFLEYPGDADGWHVSDQFLLGEDFLVCPVYKPGATKRMVYLPEGGWVNFWTGERLEGGRHIVADAPLERMPLYVRDGAVVPMERAINHTGERDGKELFLHVYAGRDGRLDLYEDAGEGFDYLQGESSTTAVTVQATEGGITVTVADPEGGFAPPREKVTLHVYGAADAGGSGAGSRRVLVNGEPAAFAVGALGETVVTVPTPGAKGFVMGVL